MKEELKDLWVRHGQLFDERERLQFRINQINAELSQSAEKINLMQKEEKEKEKEK